MKSFLQNEILNFPNLLPTHDKLISNNIDKIVFIHFNTSSGSFFWFDACKVYCFHE